MPLALILLVVVFSLFVGFVISLHPIMEIVTLRRTPDSMEGIIPSEGLVKVTGKADRDSLLRSPVTQAECVYWEVEVDEWQSRGKGSSWVQVYQDRSQGDFSVRGPVGGIQVHPSERGDLFLINHFAGENTTFKDNLTPEIYSSLKKLGVGLENMRVRERIIARDDVILVLGVIRYLQGTKTISTGRNFPFIISHLPEGKLIGKLLGIIFWRLIVAIIFGGGITVLIFLTLFPS